MISLINENITPGDIKEMVKFLNRSTKLTKGLYTEKFEKEWSEYIGCKYSVFVNSGSSANLLALATAKFCMTHQNNKVVLPALCWATDYSPLIHLGMDPIFCDINLDDLSVDIDRLEAIFKAERPAMFLLVTVLGLVPDMDRIYDLCREYDVTIIEDHCESFGSEYIGNKLGSGVGLCSTFSTYYGHHITTIEGGMVCTDNEHFYNYLLMMRSHGWTRDLSEEAKKKMGVDTDDKFNEHYTFYVPGFNLRATDIQAFLGTLQIQRADVVVNMRNAIFQAYYKQLKDYMWVPVQREGDFISAFAWPIISEDEETLKRLIDRLQYVTESRPLISRSMPTQPLTWSNKNYKEHHCPVADSINNRSMYLPCHPDMNFTDVETICDLIKSELTK